MLDLGVDLNLWPWVWLFMAVAFALIEVTLLGGSFILLPFAVSGFAASILGFYDVAIEIQWGMFLFGGAVLWIGFYRWARTFLADNLLPPGVGAERLVGMTGMVTVAVDPNDVSRLGRITVAGEIWGASGAGNEQFDEGTKIRITAMQGSRVIVEAVDETAINMKEEDL